jgi:GNAT superfamily N-acetyltransferase
VNSLPTTSRSAQPRPFEVRDLLPEERAAAITLLARGMLDNPLNIAAYGEDRERRERSLRRMFTTMFRVFTAQRPLAAIDDGVLVGVAGIAPPATCQPRPLQRLRFLPSLVAVGPSAAIRVAKWLAAWEERDPDPPHTHLGPVAVEPRLRGHGIGGQIMLEHCRQLDQAGQVSYLETDKRENVPFYQRHGYEVVAEDSVLGVSNWFMSRQPGKTAQ